MTVCDALRVQVPAHIFGGLLGTGAWVQLNRLGFEHWVCMLASYLVWLLPLLGVYGWTIFCGSGRSAGRKKSHRASNAYYWSAFAGSIEHLLYFWVFCMRQKHATTDDMRRPLEQE